MRRNRLLLATTALSLAAFPALAQTVVGPASNAALTSEALLARANEAAALPKAGGTMTGALAMGANRISGSNFGITGGSIDGVNIGATSPVKNVRINGSINWSPSTNLNALDINTYNYSASPQSAGLAWFSLIAENDSINWTSNQYLDGLLVQSAPNSAAVGNRDALHVQISVPTTFTSPTPDYVSLQTSPFASGNSTGTPGSALSYQGQLYGEWVRPRLSGGNWANYYGVENDAVTIGSNNGMMLANRAAYLIQDQSDPYGVRGTYTDAGLQFGRETTNPYGVFAGSAADTAPGFASAILFGGAVNDFPTDAMGSLITVAPRLYGIGVGLYPILSPYLYGVDLRNSTITNGGAAWASPNSEIDPSGKLYANGVITTGQLQAQTATVSGYTLTDGGAYLQVPLWQVQAPPSGTTATISTTTMGLSTDVGDAVIAIASPGAGCSQSDVLTVPGSGGGQVQVSQVTAGVPTAFTYFSAGSIAAGSFPTASTFQASISGTTLTVGTLFTGTIQVGQMVYAPGSIPNGVFITALGTGTGGAGTYTISSAQTVASGTMGGAPAITTTGGTCTTEPRVVVGWQVLAVALTAGSGYAMAPPPIAYTNSSIFKMAAITLSMSAAPSTLALNAAGGTVTVPTLRTAVVAVASLPTCNTAAEGTRAAVNNAAAPAFNTTLAGGGAVHIGAYCNGTNWIAE